jgi:hypothetical protein
MVRETVLLVESWAVGDRITSTISAVFSSRLQDPRSQISNGSERNRCCAVPTTRFSEGNWRFWQEVAKAEQSVQD